MSRHPDNASVLESNVAGGRHHPNGGPTSTMQATGDGDGTETVSVRITQAATGWSQKLMRLVLIPTP